MATETVGQKAGRLLAEGRVEPDPEPVQHFRVIGDSGIHDVFIGPHVRVCLNCPAWANGQRCSHLTSSLAWVLAQGEAAKGNPRQASEYQSALVARKVRDGEEANVVGERVSA